MKIKATKEERQEVRHEIAERLKDIIYGHAEEKAKEMFPDKAIDNFLNSNSEDAIGITLHIDMMCGDIQQIVARKRR